MSKEEYYQWIKEHDTYPEHSHQWIVKTYIDNQMFYRNFGPFEKKGQAKEFIKNYKAKYTTKGFITRWSVEPLCEVIETT